MKESIIENNKTINALEIPTLSIEETREFVSIPERSILSFFGKREFENVRLYVVSSDNDGKIYVVSSLFTPDIKEYECFTNNNRSLHLFEREFYENFDILPKNHPMLQPVRKKLGDYKFFEMKGEDVHEVAVGPIHAGVIEPGHFRFMCEGEKVYNLEIMLGYQHKGVEKMFLTAHNNRLAESVCGDSVIAYNMAYSQVIEALTGTKIPKRAEIIRRIALELERIAIHIGDMGALSGDAAYLQGAAILGTTRTLVINTMLEISGSRFGRGLIETGGVNFDIDENLSDTMLKTLEKVEKNVDTVTDVMLKMPSCISRFEKTGVVGRDTALKLNAKGPAARASGLYNDVRFVFKDPYYSDSPECPEVSPLGDVYARFCIRYSEIKQSIKYVKRFTDMLKTVNDGLKSSVGVLKPNTFAISAVEAWRGELVHIAITGVNGELIAYKIKDPSFNNWYMLSIAVRNNGVSDFPLCNKSFNLSYCGHDL